MTLDRVKTLMNHYLVVVIIETRIEHWTKLISPLINVHESLGVLDLNHKGQRCQTIYKQGRHQFLTEVNGVMVDAPPQYDPPPL